MLPGVRGGSRSRTLHLPLRSPKGTFSLLRIRSVLGRSGEMAGKRSSGHPDDKRLVGILDVEALGGMDLVEDTSM